MAIEHLLEYDDIMLIPTPTNPGVPEKLNYFLQDKDDQTGVALNSFPIFTSPMDGIIDETNWKLWADSGIKPIIPRTIPLEVRVQSCLSVWTSFSIQEVYDLWMKEDKRSIPSQFHICIDCGNGEDLKMLTMAAKLKQLYKNQLLLMGGNISNPDTYQHYCRAGIDYVRVGATSGSLVDKDHFGFHYPQASLLMKIQESRKLMIAQKIITTKIVADGGIKRPSDILKAVALGADYVMIGREFIQLLEAAGSIYKKMRDPSQPTKEWYDEISEADYNTLLPETLKKYKFWRTYHANTSPEIQALRNGFGDLTEWKKNKPGDKIKSGDGGWEWIRVTGTLKDWIKNFKEVINYGFMMTGSTGWEEFKNNSRYVAI